MKFPAPGRVALALLATACLAACATAKPQQLTAQTPSQAPDVRPEATLRLRIGDSLEVRLGGVPYDEISQVAGTYVVDTEGYVNMPHIGRVKAAGLTQAQTQQAIENTYIAKKIYSNPTITVNVPMQTRFVNVGGEVRLPQRVPYTADLTVFSAVAAAGGFSEFAAQSRVHLMRGNQMINVDIRKIRKDPTLDVPLEPGDSLEVMRSFF